MFQSAFSKLNCGWARSRFYISGQCPKNHRAFVYAADPCAARTDMGDSLGARPRPGRPRPKSPRRTNRRCSPGSQHREDGKQITSHGPKKWTPPCQQASIGRPVLMCRDALVFVQSMNLARRPLNSSQAAAGPQQQRARLGNDPVAPQHKGVGTGDDLPRPGRIQQIWKVVYFDCCTYGMLASCFANER